MAPASAAPDGAFNAAVDLLEHNLRAGRGEHLAYIDDRGRCTYAELDQRVRQAADAWRRAGLEPEQRVLLCMLDTIDLPVVFLGAIRAGIVPILANTLLTRDDYAYMLADSRARVAVVSDPLAANFAGLDGDIPTLQRVIVAGGADDALAALLESGRADSAPVAHTHADEPCFWLYSSGSTGRPKGTIHVHGSMRHTATLYGEGVLGIGPGDVVFSAAKLFFAYGLGNALSFPLSAGATTVLMAERPTPQAVFARLVDHQPTIFYGVPTLYAGLLAADDFPAREELNLRACTSAGEALPADLGERWRARTGVDILDGIGSTEMLHIFLSNRLDDVRYGTTGRPVEGYEVRIVDDDDVPVADGELGELQVRGPSSAAGYWNQREKSRRTFAGEWTRTGDKYHVDEAGYFVYGGRSDDMLKVGGIYVSPAEVESALISHPGVLEAAVVGRADDDDLVKPQAYVVVTDGHTAGPELAAALTGHVKNRIAPYKYPRWIDFVDALPKTATGKIQRYKLRAG